MQPGLFADCLVAGVEGRPWGVARLLANLPSKKLVGSHRWQITWSCWNSWLSLKRKNDSECGDERKTNQTAVKSINWEYNWKCERRLLKPSSRVSWNKFGNLLMTLLTLTVIGVLVFIGFTQVTTSRWSRKNCASWDSAFKKKKHLPRQRWCLHYVGQSNTQLACLTGGGAARRLTKAPCCQRAAWQADSPLWFR